MCIFKMVTKVCRSSGLTVCSSTISTLTTWKLALKIADIVCFVRCKVFLKVTQRPFIKGRKSHPFCISTSTLFFGRATRLSHVEPQVRMVILHEL